MNKITILIIDTNYRFIKSVINFFSCHDETHPVGGAISKQIALSMVKSHKPDVVLVDYSFTCSGDGSFVKKLITASPYSKIIITAMDDFPEYHRISLMGGAEAFIAKPDFGNSIIPLINSLFKKTGLTI